MKIILLKIVFLGWNYKEAKYKCEEIEYMQKTMVHM
jgi:hypothetical protein